MSGVPYNDLDFFARSFDQEQWAHAFGQVWFTPYVAGGASDALTALFQWYWGKTQGTHSPGHLLERVHALQRRDDGGPEPHTASRSMPRSRSSRRAVAPSRT